ncbi:hypothetical protein M0Q97_05845 [Candidatus Dojkabacteria bacterium]|jgi:hypothetical protein|nr:hypothetical protein [Candidatus Dojkabacteria bacterium]
MARLTKLNRVFNRIELNYTNLTNQITNWLSSAYNKSSILFNSASPYGQILEVVKEVFLQNMLYLKNTVRQLDIDQTVTPKMIKMIARISGHNPSRSMSANGTLKFKLKQGTNISQLVSGGQIIIYDNTSIKNKTNNLYYTIKTGNEKNYYTLTPGCQFFVNVIQGKYESQTFTGTGRYSQSYQVSVSNNSTIENFEYYITLNGINLTIKDHIYDMLENEYACVTKTGFNGDLDIYFGNGLHGVIPPIGSVIKVTYLLSNGLIGNILNNKVNDFNFIDDIYDSDGNILQPLSLFDIFVETDIKFASDGESVEYTKSVIPYVSRNFVLATPAQFIYHLKKLNMFSKVNAFNTLDMVKIDIDSDGNLDNININEMYLYLIPRITDYFSSDVNYFNVPFSAFLLDKVEKDRIITYLKKQGIVSITSSIKIIDPIPKYFVINLFIRKYDDIEEDNISEQIINILSDYFSTYERYDRVIKANLISILKQIDGIDSLNIEFIGKDNEDYHRNGALLSSTKKTVIESTYATSTNSVNISSDSYRNIVTTSGNTGSNSSTVLANSITNDGKIVPSSVGSSTIVAYNQTSQYDATKMVGIDPILGDIVIRSNELVILRGGWINRNGVYFNEDPKTTTGLNTVNIIWKGVTNRK